MVSNNHFMKKNCLAFKRNPQHSSILSNTLLTRLPEEKGRKMREMRERKRERETERERLLVRLQGQDSY